jgi:hypothetical protein
MTVGGGDASGIGFGKAECGAHQAHASVFLTTPLEGRMADEGLLT